jgi:predicted acyl esterase
MHLSRIGRGSVGVVALVALCFLWTGSASAAKAVAASGRNATPWPGGKWEPGPASYGVEVVPGIRVPMDDGVTLNATVGYPTDPSTGLRAAGTFPVLVDQTPYTNRIVPYFVQHGYIFVTVRSRGAGTSGGQFGYVSARDHQDGVETVEWAAHQLSGSNGIVGGYGCSWDGETQLYTAANIGPDSPLKAIVPTCTAQDYIRETFLVDGILAGDFPFLNFAAGAIGNQPSAVAFFQSLVAEIESGGDAAYNRDFWQSRQPIEDAQGIVDNGIPALLWSGWNDVVIRGATEFYAALQNAYKHRSPVLGPMEPHQPATGRYQIIVGPWGHGQGLDPGIMLEWYDTWLKGENTGIDKTNTPMHLYETNSDRWINTDDYPIVSKYTTYFLNAAGALTSERPDGSGSDAIAWTQPTEAGGALVYTTQPLSDGATLAGPTSATVYASSSNTNLELIATLFDVGPDQTATPITFGAVLGSQSALDPARNWYDTEGVLTRPYTSQIRDDYLSAGRTQPFSIALHPRLWSLAPGHSLRLVLTTQSPASDCASFAVAASILPCFLTAPEQATVPGGTYAIQHSASWPSAVNVPLLPYLCLNTAASGATPTSGGRIEPLDWSGKRRDC